MWADKAVCPPSDRQVPAVPRLSLRTAHAGKTAALAPSTQAVCRV